MGDDEQQVTGTAAVGDAPRVASGVESDGGESVSVREEDLTVEDGPREESGSPLDAEDYDEGAADLGGTGGANAGGAG